jgi:hypothetical protein
LYYNDTSLVNSTAYGTFRQHNYLSNTSNKNQTNSYLDTSGVEQYLNYSNPSQKSNLTTNSLNTTNIFNTLGRTHATSTYDLGKLNTLTDSKNFNNPLKYELVTKGSKLHTNNQTSLNNAVNTHEFELFNNTLNSTSKYLNTDLNYTFEDLKSGNQSLLPGERTVRLTDKLNPQKNLNVDEKSLTNSSLQNVYNSSEDQQVSYTNLNRFSGTTTTFPATHNPVLSLNTSVKDLSFDRTFIENKAPSLLQSKEESAPNIIFETY